MEQVGRNKMASPSPSAADVVEAELRSITSGLDIAAPLRQAIEYMLFPGGKRIRALLAVEICVALGGTIATVRSPAAAIEILHTSTLIHDDLPAMDNDDIRRGRASCHKAFGEATAILCGDFMLGLAISLISNAEGFTPDERLKMVTILSETYLQLCDGQQLDTLPIDRRGQLNRIHELKTGSLFGASFKIAAIAAGSSKEIIISAGDLGIEYGLSFQIADDFKDVYGGLEGRKPGSDAKNKRMTYFHGTSLAEGQRALERSKQRVNLRLDGFCKIAGLSPSQDRILSILESVYPATVDL